MLLYIKFQNNKKPTLEMKRTREHKNFNQLSREVEPLPKRPYSMQQILSPTLHQVSIDFDKKIFSNKCLLSSLKQKR
jgi:hypothetical protein